MKRLVPVRSILIHLTLGHVIAAAVVILVGFVMLGNAIFYVSQRCAL